jgi:predicted methyltransferase
MAGETTVNKTRFLSVLNEAHRLVGERLTAGDCAIDATMGNGNDTLFLARCVGPTGYVYGFDIQVEALEHTRERLLREGVALDHVVLTVESHEYMEGIIPVPRHGQATAIMFNLGFLPSGERSLITLTHTTLRALDAALRLLCSGGILTIVIYPGHPGGDDESVAICTWAAQLPQSSYQVISYQFLNVSTEPPYLIAVYKIL